MDHHQVQQQGHVMYPTPHMISTPNYTPRYPDESMSMSNPAYSGSSSGDPNWGKKKRGRPRKYSPDNAPPIDLALSPPPTPTPTPFTAVSRGDTGGATPVSDNAAKKNRGRPSGSSKKQLDALGNCGVGFTPHVIFVNTGEDIASKIVAFSKQGARTVCVLSANGTICNVDLRQPSTSGGVVKYEGRFEIISLSGSFLFSENSNGEVRTGGLSVSLAGTDGRVLGGGVVGVLLAATPVQIIVGSFIADGKKPKYMPSVTKSHATSFSAPPVTAPDDSPSQEVSSEESDDNGTNHLDRNVGSYGSSSLTVHHNTQMYAHPHMNWPNSSSKMLQG